MRPVFTLGAGAILALGVAAAGLPAAAASGSTECTVAALQSRAPRGTTIASARTVPPSGSLPQYCQVDGRVATPGNSVNFRLGLPANWNGKYYFVGVGGLAGTIGSLNAGLVRGYASASTDTGHTAGDPSWETNLAAKIDYAHRGTHVSAVAAKALTASYFGETPRHSYFNGCSNGGRQAQMEAQRYPEDFDGIIAGDPATGTPLQVGRVLVFQQMLLHPEYYLPQEKVELLSKASSAACDLADGLKDGLVSDPRRCTFTPESLKCSGADGPDCLTAPQVETVKKIYAPVKLPDGQIYAYGLAVGHEGSPTGWQAWTIGRVAPARQSDGTLAFGNAMPSGFQFSESNMRFLSLENDDPTLNWKTFRFPQDLARIERMAKELSPSDVNLTPFKNRGGKIIYYHGLADPAISAYGTIDYYDRMTKAVGGTQQADSFARLYLVPGMHHCSGGPGPNAFDMLPVLEAWVERSVAPTQVIASHAADGKVDRTRPLCPYPQVAQYTGTGSIDDAASFRCGVAAQDSGARQQLLPTGKLRVGINSGNLLTRAVGADIARDLARRLGVEALFIEYPSPGAVTDAVGKEWDIAFVAADPGREAAIAFTPPYVELDATYLVRGDSMIRNVADADRAGYKIATGATSAYTLVLKRELKQSMLVFLSNDEALQGLQAGTVDAVAGLRDSLLRSSSRVPGSRVLTENITRAQQAIAVPKANTAALAYLTTYLAEAKKSGLVASSIQKTGFVGASAVP